MVRESRPSRSRDRQWLPLDTARDTFTALVAGPDPLAVDGHLFPGLPERPIPLDEVRDLLLRPGCPRRTRDAVWRHLVQRSRGEGATWTVACVGVALPALASVGGWLAARYPGDRADIHAEVLTGFLSGLDTVDVHQPGVFPRLRWAARRAGIAALHAALDAPVPTQTGYRSSPPTPPAGHPDLVLARAVTDGVLTRTEADLIGATRLEDTRLTAWAAEHGTGHQFASRMRARAEARLLTWLTDTRDPATPEPAPASPSVTSTETTGPATGWLAPAADGTVLAVWRDQAGGIRWRSCTSRSAAQAVLDAVGAVNAQPPRRTPGAPPTGAAIQGHPAARSGPNQDTHPAEDPDQTPDGAPGGTPDEGPAGVPAGGQGQKVAAAVRETGSRSGLLPCGGPASPPSADSPISEASRCA